ncbi:MAG: translation initiation factor IF-3 [Dehalococcoidia bacterium]|nr:translation initiation factor IF-3 [Dehalococcoidia bacterium]
MNERILAPQLRVIREEEQLGIISRADALRLAEEAGLDLVEVAPTADPPVCRIMDYGKYKYEQSKREKELRKGIKHAELREVRMRVKIDEHDLDFKARTARKLLAEGDKVKVSVMFRAREITHPEVGREVLDKFVARIRDVSTIERSPALEGRMLSVIVTPGVRRERPPAPRVEAAAPVAAEAVTAEPVAAEPVADVADAVVGGS